MTTTRAVHAQTRVELLLSLRRGESLLVSFLIPRRDPRVLHEGRRRQHDLREPVDFLVPGVLALAVMATAMVSLGIATGFERRYGVLKRLGSTPLSRGGLLAAKTATVVAIEAVQALVIVATGVLLGWELTWRLVPAIVLLLIGTVAFAGIGLLMAGTLRAEANLAAANAPLPRAPVPRRDGVSAGAAARRARSRGPRCCRQPRCRRASATSSRASGSRGGASPSSSPGRSSRPWPPSRWFRWEE